MKREEVIKHCMKCLEIAHEELERLGEQGTEVEEHARSPDISTKGDVAVSKAMVEYLQSNNVPAVILTEELGETISGEEQKYTIAIDDIDGTKNYEQDQGRGILPYCTLIVAFEGTQPKYKDAVFAATIEHTSGTVWSAEQGKGLLMNGKKVQPGDTRSLSKTQTVVVLDHYMADVERFTELHKRAWVKDFGTAALHFAFAADGTLKAYVSDNQKQHELGMGYLFAKESGIWISHLDLSPIDDMPYEFEAKTDVLVAETKELAEEIRGRVKQVSL